MPNPNVLNALANPARIELPDPLDQYSKMLQMQNYLEQGDVARQKRQSVNRMREVYKNTIGPDGSYNLGKMRYGAAQAGVGENIPEIDEWDNKNKKSDADIKETEAKAQKTFYDTVGERLKISNQLLAGIDTKNPQVGYNQFAQQAQMEVSDPVYVELFKRMGVDPKVVLSQKLAKARQAAQTPGGWTPFAMAEQGHGKEALKNHHELVKTKDKQQMVAMPEYGGGAPQTVSTYGPAPVAEGTKVTINTGDKGPTELEKKVGQGLGDDFLEAKRLAGSAPQRINEIDRAYNIVDKGNAMLGAGSKQMLDVVRAAKALGMKVNDESLVDSEQLSLFFAQNTLANIARFKQMGMTLAPMSDSDRALIERASVQGTNDPATIKRLLLIQRRVEQDSILRYNDLAKQYLGNNATSKGMTNMSVHAMDPVPDRPNPATPTGLSPAAEAYLGIQ